MGLFSKLIGGKKEYGTLAYRKEQASRLHGQPVKYVTERNEDNDDVVGRGGHLTYSGDEFIIDTMGDTLFRCPVSELDVSTLMSGDGVIIHGPNSLENGRERTFTVHFVYYRK